MITYVDDGYFVHQAGMYIHEQQGHAWYQVMSITSDARLIFL